MVHQDQVNISCIPGSFINVGKSGLCETQGVYKKGRVLTYQGHAEFDTEVVLDFVKPILGESAIEKCQTGPDDHVYAARTILEFLWEEAGKEEAVEEGVVAEVIEEVAEEAEEAEEGAEETVGDGELIEEVAWDTLCGIFRNLTVEARGEYGGDSGAGAALGDTKN